MDAFFAALERAAEAAFVIDGNQRIVFWNHAAEALLGQTAGEVLGRSCYDILRGRDENDHAWCRGNCRVAVGARAGEPVETFNTLARTKDGSPRWINVTILTLPAAEGEIALVVHLCRDATELKRNEQFARQALALLESWQRPAEAGALSTARPAQSPLTERELDVLMLMAEGKSTERIAALLSISRPTARNHIQNIFQKLHVHSRAEAVAYAFQHGLLAKL
jgi:PAS domain S-box-containing protein